MINWSLLLSMFKGVVLLSPLLPYPTFMPLKRKQMLLYAGIFEPRTIRFLLIANKIKPLVKSAFRKINFLFSQQ